MADSGCLWRPIWRVVADLGNFFRSVMADSENFHHVVAGLGIFLPCGGRFGHFSPVWWQIWAFSSRVVADSGIFIRAVADLGTLGKWTRQLEVWKPK